MSEVVMTLQIDGDASGAVSAAEEAAQSLGSLAGAGQAAAASLNASGGAGEVAGAGAEAAAAGARAAGSSANEASGAAGNFSGSLRSIAGAAGEMSGSLGPVTGMLAGVGGAATEMTGGLSGVVAVAAAVATAIFELGKVGADWANETMRGMAVTGMSQDQFETWGHAMAIAGGNGESLGMAMRILRKDLEQSADPKFANDFAQLGIGIDRSNSAANDATEIFPQVIERLASLENPVERATIGQQIFGRSWLQIVPLVENFNEIMPTAAKLTATHAGAMGNATEQAIKYNAANEDLKANVQELGIIALPVLNEGIKGTSNALGAALHPVEFFGTTVQALGDVLNPAPLIAYGAEAINLGAKGYGVSAALGLIGDVAVAAGGGIESLTGVTLPGIASFLGFGDAADSAAGGASNLGEASGGTIGTLMSLGASSDGAATGADSVGGAASSASPRVSRMASSMDELTASQASFRGAASTIVSSFGEIAAMAEHAGQSISEFSQMLGTQNTSPSPAFTPFSSLTGHAAGGSVSAGIPSIVGELGPELFIPSSDGTIIPNSALSVSGGSGGYGGGTTNIFNISIVNHGPVGISDLKREINDTMREVAQNQTGLRGYLATAS